MKLNYIKSQSFIKPELVDNTSSKTTVYLRQNIVEKEIINEDGESIVFYEYEEAKLTKEEYQEYLKEYEETNSLQVIEDLKEENKSLNDQIYMLTGCILEMSEILYA